MNDAATWLGLTIIIIIVGTFAIVWFTDREKTRGVLEEEQWQERFEPNRDGDLAPHTPPDVLTERPVLPDDYQDWNFR